MHVAGVVHVSVWWICRVMQVLMPCMCQCHTCVIFTHVSLLWMCLCHTCVNVMHVSVTFMCKYHAHVSVMHVSLPRMWWCYTCFSVIHVYLSCICWCHPCVGVIHVSMSCMSECHVLSVSCMCQFEAVLWSRNYLFRLQLRLRLSKSFRSGSDWSFLGTCFHNF